MLTTQALHPKVEPEILFIRSLNRDDWNAQLKVSWRMDGNWRLTAGADIFSGPATGLFGQFDKKTGYIQNYAIVFNECYSAMT